MPRYGWRRDSVEVRFTDDEAVEAVHRAIDLGINYLDTAPLYGESERRVGLALADGWREKIYLATKTGTHPEWRGDFSAAGTRRSVENSLRLLGTDYLDVCLVHDPDSMAPVVAKDGALDELQRMREEGLIKFIGLGVRQHGVSIRIAIENRCCRCDSNVLGLYAPESNRKRVVVTFRR